MSIRTQVRKRRSKALVKKSSKRKDCKHMPKESVEEFLLRGGQINVIALPSEQLR